MQNLYSKTKTKNNQKIQTTAYNLFKKLCARSCKNLRQLLKPPVENRDTIDT